MPKKKTLADLGKVPIEADKVYILPDEATKQVVDALTTTELEQVQAEIDAIKPTLPELKTNNSEEYKKAYKRFLWLVEQREQLKGNG